MALGERDLSTTSPSPSNPAVEPDDGYPRKLLLTVIAGIVVFSSSMTIVSASLPTMAEDLGSTESFLAWSVTGLFLVMAVGTPILGRLGDVFGHRRLFLTGSIVLGIGTVLCGLAPTAFAFVAARMVVGLGIAATFPTAMALIMDAYPPSRRSEAMGWFQMAMTGAPVMGLIIGGPLIDAFGWRMLFAVLAPISFVGSTLAWKVIHRDPPRSDADERITIDWAGAATLGVATLGFLLFLERGAAVGFTDSIALGLGVVAAASLATFIKVEQRATQPMLRLDYFRRKNFTGPLIANPLSQFAYMGGFVIAPLLLDELFGYSVSIIAFVLLARPLVYSVASPLGGRLASTVGERVMVLSGSVLMVASMFAWVLGARWVSMPMIMIGLVLSGLAMGLASPSYSTTVAAAVDDGDLGIANAMNATVMNIGMLTGIQTMFLVLGDGRSPNDFGMVFLFGGLVAAVGIVGGLMVTSSTPADADHDVETDGGIDVAFDAAIDADA